MIHPRERTTSGTPTAFSAAADHFLDTALGSLGIGGAESAGFRRGVRTLMRTWEHLPVERTAGQDGSYFAANDGAPFELSVSWQPQGFEVRLGCDAVTETPGLLARQASGLALTRSLTMLLGTDAVERFVSIEELFTSAEPRGSFALMHVVGARPGTEPGFKLYLNPAVHGRGRAAATVAQAMHRLAMTQAWSFAAKTLRRKGLEDHLAVFAVDLTCSREARVKVYVNLPDCSPADVEDIAKLSAAYRPGRALSAYATVYEDTVPSAKAPMLCLAFTSALDVPAAVNLYLPLDPNLPNDEASLAAVEALMRSEGIDPFPHRTLVENLCPGKLNQSRMQSWVSCQIAGHPRVTTYIGPELYPRPTGHHTAT